MAAAADRQRIIEAALNSFGGIDMLINNAGLIEISDPLRVGEDEWDRVQAVNLKGTYFMCQAVLPHMLDRGTGRIVNVASMAAKAGSPLSVHYNVSKAGVVALTRNLAVAYGERGITINCVCPGVVQTAMWEKIDRQAGALLGIPAGEFMKSRLKAAAIGRAGTPEDVANVVSFLCSDDAGYMTGQAVNVTGGMIFH